MTTSFNVPNVGGFLSDVQKIDGAINEVVSFAQQYDSVLPAPFKNAVNDVAEVTGFIKSLLSQVGPAGAPSPGAEGAPDAGQQAADQQTVADQRGQATPQVAGGAQPGTPGQAEAPQASPANPPQQP